MNILHKLLNVSNTELDSLNVDFIKRYQFYHDISYFQGRSGREHYRLLMYVSNLFEKETLYDVGTNRCMSAAALSYSMKNKIKTYDIQKILSINPILPKVQYIIGDVRDDKGLKDTPFIFFDVDHDGKFEKLFYDHLIEINYKGLLMCDDIHLNDPMKEWWDNIKEDKYDLTPKGHWSGTGLVHFK